ncbi:MAG: ribosome silencing factor [Xanthomonadales bacterium]|nr:ribosome silencing factor [Xanthomonadales bacterium]
MRALPPAEAGSPLTTTKKPVRTPRTSRAPKTANKVTTGKPAAKAVKKAGAARKATTKAPAAKAKAPSRTIPPSAELALPKAPRKRAKPAAEADVVARLQRVVKTALEDLKAKDVREIDVRGKTSVADLIVVASGTSTRHVKSIADEVVRSAKQAGLPPLGVEGQREAEWVLVDLGDIIVHVMLPRTREFYGLERLWTIGDDAVEAPRAS